MARRGRKKIYKEIMSRMKPRAMLSQLRKGKQSKGRRRSAAL